MFFEKVVYYWSSSKLSFMLFMVNLFFILIHFLVVEGYELPKITSHVLSVPLNPKCVRILSWFISYFVYFSCFPDDVLRKAALWADDNALNYSCDTPSDLSQQVPIWSLKYGNAISEISENAILSPIIYWHLGNYSVFTSWSIHINLKRRILIALFLLAP